MTKDMTRGTPWKLIVQFALPIMAGNLLQQLYNTADTIIVGNFNGQQALSAVGSCASLTALFTALAIGFSSARACSCHSILARTGWRNCGGTRRLPSF